MSPFFSMRRNYMFFSYLSNVVFDIYICMSNIYIGDHTQVLRAYSWQTLRKIWDARDQIQINRVQCKHPTCSTITQVPLIYILSWAEVIPYACMLLWDLSSKPPSRNKISFPRNKVIFTLFQDLIGWWVLLADNERTHGKWGLEKITVSGDQRPRFSWSLCSPWM